MWKLLRKQCFAPKHVVSYKLRSYSAAFRALRLTDPHEQGLRMNYSAENRRQIVQVREGKMQRFKSAGSAQQYLSIHAVIQNSFYVQRHLIFRSILRIFGVNGTAH